MFQRFRIGLYLFAALAAAGDFGPSAAHAHASEQGFVLLLPTDQFIAAGCLTVFASMVLITLLPIRSSHRLFESYKIAPSAHFLRIGQFFWGLVATFCVAVLIVGVIGPRDPLANVLPLFFWTVWWMGGLVAVAVFGTLVVFPGPWHQSRPGTDLSVRNCWPALVIFAAFGFFSTVDPAPEDPDRLANILAGYLLFTALGALFLGPQTWMSRYEPATILFRLLARLSPVQVVPDIRIGLPGWGALTGQSPSLSTAFFCLFLLGIGSFDGLKETFWWLAQLGVNPLEFPGRTALVWPNTIGMIGFVSGLILAFWVSVWLGVALAGKDNVTVETKTVFCWFSLSLLPIAVGYHAAHFLVSFMINIQYVPLALTDPLATGANYLGFSQTSVTTGFLNTQASVKTIWLSQAGIVVVSHVLAVLMAHWVACHLFIARKQVILVQIPIAVLMMGYTLFGLWLLAAPRGV